MMKQFLSMLMMVMVLLTSTTLAQAEPLRERLDAPATYQTEASSPSGKSRIIVDAVVEVPEAENVPLYEVAPRIFSVEEVLALCDWLYEGSYVRSQDDQGLGNAYEIRANKQQGVVSGSLYYNGKAPVHYQFPNGATNQDVTVAAYYSNLAALPTVYEGVQLGYYIDESHNTGRNMPSKENARFMADNLISSLYPAYELRYFGGEPMGETSLRNRMGGGHGYDDDYGYRLYFSRNIAGIPVNCSVTSMESSIYSMMPNDLASAPMGYEIIYVDVGENGLFQFLYENPMEIRNELQVDCELLNFKQVMNILRTIGPLSIASYEGDREADARNEIEIDRIVFGYMAVPMRNDPLRYQLVPVWDFYGTRRIDHEVYDAPLYSLLTINAIDGTIIDRKYGY